MAQRKSQHPRRERISADGTPYSVWQVRTHVLSLVLAVWAAIEIVTGAGFQTLESLGIFDFASVLSGFTLGSSTIISGAFNLLLAFAGLWGAHDPRRITVFFWAALINAVLGLWQVASLLSMGQFDVTTFVSVGISLIYAICGWQVRAQTGYFDNHPHPEDDMVE